MKKLTLILTAVIILAGCKATAKLVEPKGQTVVITERYSKHGKLKRKTTSTTTRY
jgi:uncharacterized protein YcfL